MLEAPANDWQERQEWNSPPSPFTMGSDVWNMNQAFSSWDVFQLLPDPAFPRCQPSQRRVPFPVSEMSRGVFWLFPMIHDPWQITCDSWPMIHGRYCNHAPILTTKVVALPLLLSLVLLLLFGRSSSNSSKRATSRSSTTTSNSMCFMLELFCLSISF